MKHYFEKESQVDSLSVSHLHNLFTFKKGTIDRHVVSKKEIIPKNYPKQKYVNGIFFHEESCNKILSFYIIAFNLIDNFILFPGYSSAIFLKENERIRILDLLK